MKLFYTLIVYFVYEYIIFLQGILPTYCYMLRYFFNCTMYMEYKFL